MTGWAVGVVLRDDDGEGGDGGRDGADGEDARRRGAGEACRREEGGGRVRCL